jgi:hypothetical protein
MLTRNLRLGGMLCFVLVVAVVGACGCTLTCTPMADLQELVDNGYCESIADCERRMPINNLVRFHYSYEVHFRKRP